VNEISEGFAYSSQGTGERCLCLASSCLPEGAWAALGVLATGLPEQQFLAAPAARVKRSYAAPSFHVFKKVSF